MNPNSVSIIHENPVQKEEGNIIVGFPRSERQDLATLKALTFMSSKGEKIRLDDIAEVDFRSTNREIYTDDRSETVHIYAEL